MKNIWITACLCLACFWLFAAEPLPETQPALVPYKWALGYEALPGVSHILSPDEHYERWIVYANFTHGLTFRYSLDHLWEIQTGLYVQKSRSVGNFIHPQPYLIERDLNVSSKSVRLPIIFNRDVYRKGNLYSRYLGLGVFLDKPSKTELLVEDYYINGIASSGRDLRNELGDYIPGLLVQLGIRAGRSRMELRYWVDFSDFTLPETHAKSLRRSGIALSSSLDLFRYRK